jgi:hypothetical protein
MTVPPRVALLVFSLVVGSSPAALAQQYVAMRLPRGATVTVDGALSEFADAPSLTVTNTTTGAQGVYRLLWDDQGLYVAGEVADTHLYTLETLRDDSLWEDDSLEIMFCTLNNRGSTDLPGDDDYKLFVSAANVQADERGNDVWLEWNATWASAAVVSGTLNDNGDTDVGYRLELAITWADWQITPPTAGTHWGLEVTLNDRISTAIAEQVSWANTNAGSNNDPDGWGTLIFSECSPGAIPCPPRDECHDVGTCDNGAGTCSYPARTDGSPCAGGSGSCQGGTCVLHDGGVDDAGGDDGGVDDAGADDGSAEAGGADGAPLDAAPASDAPPVADGAAAGRSVPLAGWRCDATAGGTGATRAGGALLPLLLLLGGRRRRSASTRSVRRRPRLPLG